MVALEVLKNLRKHTVSSYYKEVDRAISEVEQLQAKKMPPKEIVNKYIEKVEEVLNAVPSQNVNVELACEYRQAKDNIEQALKGERFFS